MASLAKAQLHELDADFKRRINPECSVTVQFNPESLKVSFANRISTPSGAGDQRGTPPRLFVGAGTMGLTVELWFDVTAPLPNDVAPATDVRALTQRVVYFITPKAKPRSKGKFTPPGVQFVWGSFKFEGVCESLEESLEFFSGEGRPLRAKVTLTLTQQKIEIVAQDAGGPAGAPDAGRRPHAQAPQNGTVQQMAAATGTRDWQGVAAANGIENPRLLAPGQLVDLNASVSLGAGVGAGASASLGASVRASARLGFEVGAAASIGVTSSINASVSGQVTGSAQGAATAATGGGSGTASFDIRGGGL